MLLPDVNVLLYAFRDEAMEHAAYHAWLSRVVSSPEPFAISEAVLASVARIATNRRIYTEPSRLELVLEFADALLKHPRAVRVRPGERHWRIFSDLCRASDARGNDVPDAWLAALAIEQGCELATADRGFARYRPVRYRHPLDG